MVDHTYTGRARWRIRVINGPTLYVWANSSGDAIARAGLYGEETSIESIEPTELVAIPYTDTLVKLTDDERAELDELVVRVARSPR